MSLFCNCQMKFQMIKLSLNNATGLTQSCSASYRDALGDMTACQPSDACWTASQTSNIRVPGPTVVRYAVESKTWSHCQTWATWSRSRSFAVFDPACIWCSPAVYTSCHAMRILVRPGASVSRGIGYSAETSCLCAVRPHSASLHKV